MDSEVKYHTIDDIDIIEMYEEILKGTRKKFVDGTWQRPDAISNSIKVIKYLVEEKLKLTDEELKEQLSLKLFKDNRLRGMLQHCFNNSPYKAINTAYPNKFKEWEFKNTSRDFWTKENGIEATKWLIEEKLKLTDEELKEQLSIKLFKDNNLLGMLSICFNYSTYRAIDETYPNKFKEWEFKQVPINFWTKEKGIEVTKWLIEEKLKLTDDEIKEHLSQKLFRDNGLISMLNYCFNSSPYKAINETYPNKFKEWEFSTTPNNFWNKEKGLEATKWLMEEKLKLTDEQLKEQLSTKLFEDNGLIGMLSICFNSSPYQTISETYPNKFKEWEFKNVPINLWTKEKGIEATKWLIEEKLKLTDEEIKEQLSQKLFRDNNLSGMLQQCFKGSPYQAINETYPNKFKPEDFKYFYNCS